MEKLWNYISKFLCSLIEALKRPGETTEETTEVRMETDFDDHQTMLDFLNEPSPKARGEHKKEVTLSNGSVFRTVFPIPTSPEKTKAAATETSKEDGLATGTNAEKKRRARTFGKQFLYRLGPFLLMVNRNFLKLIGIINWD